MCVCVWGNSGHQAYTVSAFTVWATALLTTFIKNYVLANLEYQLIDREAHKLVKYTPRLPMNLFLERRQKPALDVGDALSQDRVLNRARFLFSHHSGGGGLCTCRAPLLSCLSRAQVEWERIRAEVHTAQHSLCFISTVLWVAHHTLLPTKTWSSENHEPNSSFQVVLFRCLSWWQTHLDILNANRRHVEWVVICLQMSVRCWCMQVFKCRTGFFRAYLE